MVAGVNASFMQWRNIADLWTLNLMPLLSEYINYNAANIQTINAGWLLQAGISLDILRLDKIHSVVSGNKWFKLQYYLQEAQQQGSAVATFGGAYSNHIIAVAWACMQAGITCVGIIRGERPSALSYTLQTAEKYGMHLYFVTRAEYRTMTANSRQQATQAGKNNSGEYTQAGEPENKNLKHYPTNNPLKNPHNFYWIAEGGYGKQGAQGAAGIGVQYDLCAYTHIIAGVGTGTMLAGLMLSANLTQKIIGISAMKGNDSLEQEVWELVKHHDSLPDFTIFHQYHFGGFGKQPKALKDFIAATLIQYHLPLDIIYTGKVFYGIKDLSQKKYFEPGSKLLMIHSGGLQGNQ